MYFIPNYVTYHEEDGAIFITSNLRQNTVKLTAPEIINEFYSIVKDGGCANISTELTSFLHEQELLINKQELVDALNELEEVLNDSLVLTIMPTEACNFRCTYCYENHESITMSYKTLDHILTYISEQIGNFKKLHISWFGGEPTLCKDTILRTSNYIKKLKRKNSFDYAASMTTNGYLLSLDDFVDYYNAGVTSYQITLDGWEHDLTRSHITGTGTLNTIMENLIAISKLPQEEYQYQIALRHNILQDSACEDWYDYLFKLFGKDKRFFVRVRAVGNWGGDSVTSLKLLSKDNANDILQKHLDYIRKIGLLSEDKKTSPLSLICYASYPHSMVFRANGKIEKCTVCLDHPANCIGQVYESCGIKIDEDVNRKWYKTSLTENCIHCSNVLACLNKQCRKAQIVDAQSTCTVPSFLQYE